MPVLTADLDSRNPLPRVKVVPGASRPEIVGSLRDALQVRVAAPPEKGRANEELRRVVRAATGAPRVLAESGHGGPGKTPRLRGKSLAAAPRGLGI